MFGAQKQLHVINCNINQVQNLLFLKKGNLLLFLMLDVFLKQFHFSNEFFDSIFILEMIDFHFEVVFLLRKGFKCKFRELKLFFEMFESSDLLFADTVDDDVDELEGFFPHVY
jgi:hypothetical protein